MNHRKKMKAEPSRLIPLKPIEDVELFIDTEKMFVLLRTKCMQLRNHADTQNSEAYHSAFF